MVTVLAGGPLSAACARQVEQLAQIGQLEVADAESPKGEYPTPYQVRRLPPGEFWRPRFSFDRSPLPVGLPLPTGGSSYPSFLPVAALTPRLPLLSSGDDWWAALRPLWTLGAGAELLTPVSLVAGAFVGVTSLYAGIFPAGSPANIAIAANQMNAYNDLARSPGSPCAYEPVIQDEGEEP